MRFLRMCLEAVMNEQCIWCFCWDGKIILDHCYLLSGHLENRSKESHPLTPLLEVQGVISTSVCSCDPWFKHSREMNQTYFFLNVTKKCQSTNPIFFLSLTDKVYIQTRSAIQRYPTSKQSPVFPVIQLIYPTWT